MFGKTKGEPNFHWVIVEFPDELSPRQRECLDLIKVRLSKICDLFSFLYPNGFIVVLKKSEEQQELSVTVTLSPNFNTYKGVAEKLKKAFQDLSLFITKNYQIVHELGLTEIIISPDTQNYEDVKPKKKDGLEARFPVDPKWSMQDLEVPDVLLSDFDNMLSLVENHSLIFDEWGLRKIQPAPKLIINFYGPPGTGKTMAAHGLANRLGKQILEFSYAQIESKYVGDGPKNLHRAFELASKHDAVLFFDEADSLLGKRIENITEGSEQAVNSMRSQMLLEIDKFEGIAIFATNLVKNYDFGFDSRLMHVKFDLPERLSRKKMFLRFFLDTLPGKEFVDFDILADLSVGLSGRDIRDVILVTAGKMAKDRDQNTQNINAVLQNSISYIKSKRILQNQLS